VLILADRRGVAHRGRTLLTERHQHIILGHVLNPNAPAISQCVREVQRKFQAEGMFVPSDPTIRRFAKAYMTECFDSWTAFREGEKAWNDKCAISLLRNWNLVEVGDVVIADGHTLNFESIDPDTGKPKRMTLVLFYDGASNCPLGWQIMATENTACISAAFRRSCIILGKFPRVIYLDNGRAFRILSRQDSSACTATSAARSSTHGPTTVRASRLSVSSGPCTSLKYGCPRTQATTLPTSQPA
jgi:putative transposase